MTTIEDTRATILRLLYQLRPEAAGRPLPPDADLREELDLDSMDFLNFVLAIDEAVGVEIPEEDYTRLATLDECVAYVDARRPHA
jgi:acyl carrier protein